MSNGYAPWEKAFDRLIDPFEEFVHNQTTSGKVLIFSTLAAMIIANSPLYGAYHHFFETMVGISVGEWRLELSIHHWINDGLMAIFFFVVGLEIKREVLGGELSNPQQAILPVAAAIGGMVVPALIYYAFNPTGPASNGWGVPMATDIAFALGVMAIIGSRVPTSLKAFLVALAIVDDLGAVLVIAVFYTDAIVWEALGAAALVFAILMAMNFSGVRNPGLYAVVWVFMWLAMVESGVHATIAGVLGALTVPARSRYQAERLSDHVRETIAIFDDASKDHIGAFYNDKQKKSLKALIDGIEAFTPLSQRLEHFYHLPVALMIIPIFALANAGIPIDFSALDEIFTNPIPLGVGLGLIVGKLIGVAGVSILLIKLGIAPMPQGTTIPQIFGAACLAGIGFTMSIFISELAFAGFPEQLVMAKTGVLFASLIAGITGYIWLKRAVR